MAVERIRQQKTPGQFGSDVTSLSAVDVGAASYARPGVKDLTKAVEYEGYANLAQNVGNIVSGAAKAGNEFYEGLQIADVEKAHEANIDEYIASKKNPQIAQEAAVDAFSLDATSNALWNKIGEGASIEDIDGIEKQYQSKLSTMKKAVAQGVMSQDEFAQRSLAITREAINRNPALHDEIINHTKKVMNLSGMDALLKAEQSQGENAQKAYDKTVEYHMSIAKAENIPVTYDRQGNVDLVSLKQKTDQAQLEKASAEAIIRQGNVTTAQGREQARDFVSKFGYQGANGIINNVNSFVSQLVSNPENKGEQTTKIRQAYAMAKQLMADKTGQLMHYPEVKEVYDYFVKTADANMAMYEKLSTREDQKNFADNSASILRNQQFQEVSKVANPAAVNMLTSMLQQVGPRLLAENPTGYGKIIKTLGNVFSEVSNGLDTDYSIKDQSGKSAVAGAVQLLARDSGNGNQDAKTVLDKAVNTIYADSKTKFNSTEDKFKFYDDYIKAMADPSTKEGWRNISEGSRDKATQNFEEYMQLTMAGFSKDLGAVANKGTEVKLGRLPDGRLTIQTSNQVDTDLLNQKYGIRINNGLKAFANLIGSETKAASDVMFQQYEGLKDVVPVKESKDGEGRPNASNPLNLTIPGKTGKFQQFDSTEDGIRAASAQLDRYFTGKTPGTGTGLNTLDQIGGKWNNEHEKGSTSKKNYVATLVKHMGVDANVPLDLNNPNVKADLIYAMSVAEGRPVRPSQIMAALGK